MQKFFFVIIIIYFESSSRKEINEYLHCYSELSAIEMKEIYLFCFVYRFTEKLWEKYKQIQRKNTKNETHKFQELCMKGKGKKKLLTFFSHNTFTIHRNFFLYPSLMVATFFITTQFTGVMYEFLPRHG